VIFILEGHAFPGYWRSPNDHADFEQAKRQPDGAAADADAAAELVGQRVPWQLRKGAYREVVSRIYERQLVPLETVALTRQESFEEALRQGRERLGSRRDFHSLIDIVLARTNQVTPLPIREARD
ncbi:MAG TPA: hypothetical protein VJU18_12920, partial [Vicinamibacteria bacterium]|nr:hypothetical protein [Vicinamibacteria bacterium]